MTTDRYHELSSDEIRRELRAAQTAHAEALPGWRRALDRLLDPTSGATDSDKSSFLGVPPRRAFLVGGVVVTGGALLAACGKKKNGQTPLTGQIPPDPSSTTTTAPGSRSNDEELLRTAQSIEVLAVDTYQKALDSGLVKTNSVKDTFILFQAQHRDHANALDGPIEAAGTRPVTTGNEYLSSTVIDKAVSELTDEKSVIVLAREVENIAAQTYTEAGGVLTTSTLRRAAMSVGAIEARHITVFNLALGYSPAPLPLLPTRLAIDPKGYVRT